MSNPKINQLHSDDRPFNHYFQFGDIENIFDTLLSSWDSCAERYGTEIVDYFVTLPNLDGNRRFIAAANLVHAIVEVDERIAKSNEKVTVPFLKAIRSASAPYSKLNSKVLESSLEAIEATRHSITHPQSILKNKAAHGLDLAHAEAFLDSVLRCLLWTRLGLSEPEIRALCLSHPMLNDKLSMNFWREIV